MIPKFKTYLKESVWGDIRKKSIGQEIREEDNINNLDGRAFVDYLKQQYDYPTASKTGDSFVVLYRETITILLSYILDSAMMKTGNYEYLFYDLEKNVIYISEYSKIYKYPIFKKLCNKFDVKKKAYKSSMSNDTTIKPKNGDTSKRFFMELIDFFEDNAEHPFYRTLVKKNDVNESVWGSIRKKSTGQETRIEDNINFLDGKGMYNYVTDRYNDDGFFFETEYDTDDVDILKVPFLRTETSSKHIKELMVFYDFEDNIIHISTDCPLNVRQKLEEVYILKEYETYYFQILPKDNSEVNNSFFIGLMDYICEIIKDMDFECILTRNNVNESIWGDVRKKSLGLDIRNEDLINLENLDNGTMDDLYNYVIQNYEYTKEPVSEQRSIRLFGNDLFIPITLDGKILNTSLDSATTDDIEFLVVNNELVKYLDDEAYARYFDYVEKDNPDDKVTKIIVDGDYFPKRNVIGILDALLENVQNPALRKKEIKESVWGSIRKKSMGQEVRIEDDVNLLDGDGLCEYIKTRYEYIDTNNDPEIYGFRSKQHYVEVPLLKYGYAPYKIFLELNADSGRWLSISPYKGKYIMFPYVASRKDGKYIEPEIYNILREEYDTEEVYEMKGFDRIIHYLSIRPKDGSEITNQFFLDVIDFALDNMTDPFKPTIKKL